VRDEVAELLRSVLSDAGLEVTEIDDHRVMTMLSGEWKRTIPVLFDLDERSLKVSSLFSGAPDEGHEAVYRVLLQRNQRSGPVHFALDDEGDLVLLGSLPLDAVDEQRLDGLLGVLLSVADETFNQVLRTGFASYLAAEQRWRAKVGLAPNPVGTPVPPEGAADGAADDAPS
jgi:hypothetical protein